MLVFGGIGKVILNDVWALPLSGEPDWAQLAPTGDPPPGRFGHTTIFDPVRDRLIVFSGCVAEPDGEVWILSLSPQPAWSHILPGGPCPPGRLGHTAIYDPVRDRMVVFGGCTGGAIATNHYFGDVWALSLRDDPTWTQLTTAGELPGPLTGHSAIYDPVRDRMLVFGGVSGRFAVPDSIVWALSLGATPTWSQIPTTGVLTGEWAGHSAQYDSIRDRMIVVGSDDRVHVMALSLTPSPEWTALEPSGAPNTRDGVSAIYDHESNRIVMFGNDSEGEQDDVWSLSLAPQLAWTALRHVRGPFPALSYRSAAVFDDAHDRVVLTADGDVWALPQDGSGDWVHLEAGGTPPGNRSGATALYDPVRKRLLLFGGFTGGPIGGSEEVWALSLTDSTTWSRLTPIGTTPPVREKPVVVYDSLHDRAVMFGGAGSTYLNDLWELSLEPTPEWRLLASAAAPTPRGSHSGIYDPVRDRLLVFGGGTYGGDLNDTWALPLSGALTWTQLTPDGAPPAPRDLAASVYDSAGDRMLLFGGEGASWEVSRELWELAFANGPAWRQLHPDPAGGGPASEGLAMPVYDSRRGRLVVGPWTLVPPTSAPPIGGAIAMGAAYPNPARGGVTVDFSLGRAERTSVRVFDLAGRLVRTAYDGALAAGPHSIGWDGRRATGERAPTGLYFVEIRSSESVSTRKVTLIE
jgi:hypothetical protein